MKSLWWLPVVAILLSGCSEKMFETVSDAYVTDAAQMRQTELTLPEDAARPVSTEDTGALYVGEGYTVTVQTLPGGDLNRSLMSVTGFSKDRLSVLERNLGQLRRYEYAWSCAGEGGDAVCRGVLLDDGNYHYVLSVSMDEAMAETLQQKVQALCASFQATL